eukprot:276129_1
MSFLSRQLVHSSKAFRTPLYATATRKYNAFILSKHNKFQSKPQNIIMHKICIRSCSSDLTQDLILERITKVLGDMERAKVDDKNPITPETNLFKGVGLDSLDFVEFGIALEDEFGIEIDDDVAEKIETIGDAIKIIQEMPAAK